MTSTLDINTTRGQQALRDQQRAMEIVFQHATPDHQFIHTGGQDAARVDGVIVRNKWIHSVAEVKSRDISYETLMGSFRGEWLLTFAKLEDLAKTCLLFNANGYGFLYLVPDGIVLAVLLCDKTGRIVCEHRTEQTTTMKTCNGGTAARLNAFVEMQNARLYRS